MRPSFCLHSAVLNKWCACLLLASFFPLLRLPAPQSQSAVKIETALFAVIVRKPQCLFRIQTEVWKRCGWICDSSVVPQRHNNTCMWLYPDSERLSICWCFVLWLSGGLLVSPRYLPAKSGGPQENYWAKTSADHQFGLIISGMFWKSCLYHWKTVEWWSSGCWLWWWLWPPTMTTAYLKTRWHILLT